MTEESNSKELNFFTPFLFLVAFVVGLVLLFVLFSNLNKQRAQKVYQVYAKETQEYVERNKSPRVGGNIIDLFEVFNSRINSCLSRQVEIYNCGTQTDFRSSIDTMVTHDLKDWSSTSFLIRPGSGDHFYIIGPSGESGSSYGDREKINVVEDLFDGKKSEIPWDDYFGGSSGKEVIIPVKDNLGRIVGGVIRATIDSKTF